MDKAAGIWIDHRQAVIVAITAKVREHFRDAKFRDAA